MTETINENLKRVRAAAEVVQAEVKRTVPIAGSTEGAENLTKEAAATIMTPIVNKSLEEGVDGSDILDAIHKGTTDANRGH